MKWLTAKRKTAHTMSWTVFWVTDESQKIYPLHLINLWIVTISSTHYLALATVCHVYWNRIQPLRYLSVWMTEGNLDQVYSTTLLDKRDVLLISYDNSVSAPNCVLEKAVTRGHVLRGIWPLETNVWKSYQYPSWILNLGDVLRALVLIAHAPLKAESRKPKKQ